jgi:hypothetical protein
VVIVGGDIFTQWAFRRDHHTFEVVCFATVFQHWLWITVSTGHQNAFYIGL